MQDDAHFLILCRYVEANALRAGNVSAAEKWPWSGLWQRANRVGDPWMKRWPVDRPANWLQVVNARLPDAQLTQVRQCVVRGRPWGEPSWVHSTADRLSLTFTLRDVGRPSKKV